MCRDLNVVGVGASLGRVLPMWELSRAWSLNWADTCRVLYIDEASMLDVCMPDDAYIGEEMGS